MSSEKPSYEELVKELIRAYELLDEALPLALRLLKKGWASLIEQQFFWSAVHFLEHDGHGMDLLDLDNEDKPVDARLYARLDELRELLDSEATEPNA